MAVLNSGEQPLWFQLGEKGPELLNSVSDACYSAALVPWPLALHVRYLLAHGDEVLMAVNRDGFFRFAPWENPDSQLSNPQSPVPSPKSPIMMFRYSNSNFWKDYTVTSFFIWDNKPVALLYRDDRFLETGAALPFPRAYTINLQSSVPQPIDIPAFRRFSPNDGWDVDVLRLSANGLWHYRAVKKVSDAGEILYFRSTGLDREGEETSLGAFQNSAIPAPLYTAHHFLISMFSALDIYSGGTVMAVSPDFPCIRYFADSSGIPVNTLVYFREEDSFVLAIDPIGHVVYSSISGFYLHALPELPENFVYTGVAMSGQTIIASWEEQEEFNIGAAGFMVLRILTER